MCRHPTLSDRSVCISMQGEAVVWPESPANSRRPVEPDLDNASGGKWCKYILTPIVAIGVFLLQKATYLSTRLDKVDTEADT